MEIRYWKEEQQIGSASLTRAELAALTTELIFPLAEVEADSVVEQVDLLDFPGYRGRLKITALEEAGREGLNPICQLLLRGKVAYLFERYTDNQEMNALVVCASSAKQSDVADVGPVLNRWVEKRRVKAPKNVRAVTWAVLGHHHVRYAHQQQSATHHRTVKRRLGRYAAHDLAGAFRPI